HGLCSARACEALVFDSRTARPRVRAGHGYDTFAQGGEQGRRDQVGGRAGVASIADRAQPGIELGVRGRGTRRSWPAGLEHVLGVAAGLTRFVPATLAEDQAVGMLGE